MNQHSRPIWFAVLVAPWAGPAALVVCSSFWLLLTEGVGGLKDWPVASGFFVFGLPITYAATLAFGLPYVLWLRARGTLTFPLVCLGATLAGAFLPFLRLFLQPHLQPEMLVVVSAAGLGLVSGAVFCIAAGITVRSSGRPIRAAA